MNKTLEQIAAMPRDQIKIIDNAKTQLYPLTWHNIITIFYEGRMKRVTRKAAFAFGLCDAPGHVYKPEAKRGGKREGSGREPLPTKDKKRPRTIYFSDFEIERIGGWERAKKLIDNCLKQKM